MGWREDEAACYAAELYRAERAGEEAERGGEDCDDDYDEDWGDDGE